MLTHAIKKNTLALSRLDLLGELRGLPNWHLEGGLYNLVPQEILGGDAETTFEIEEIDLLHRTERPGHGVIQQHYSGLPDEAACWKRRVNCTNRTNRCASTANSRSC